MAMQSRLRSWRERVRSFASAKGGNVAMTFGLLRHSDRRPCRLRRRLQPRQLGQGGDAVRGRCHRADAVERGRQPDDAEIASKATSYFNALFNRTDVNNVSITPTYTTTGGSQVVITATGTMPTTILKADRFRQPSTSTSRRP